MKKHLLVLFSLLCCLCISTGLFSACNTTTKPHTHDFKVVEQVLPTCEEEGHILKKCSCGEEQREVLPAKGHIYGDWIDEVPATCGKTGAKGHYHCEACNKNFDKDKKEITDIAIPTVPHTFGEWIEEIPATCIKTGVKGHYHCNVCNKNFDIDKNEITDLVISYKGHTYSEWIEEVPATCTEDGVKGHYHCSVCNKDYDKNNDEITDLVISSKGHAYGEWIEEIPATCTKDGVKGHYHCPVCNKDFDIDKKEMTDLVISSKGHNYGEWIEEIPATCIKTGVKGHYHCDVCNKDFDTDKNELTSLVIPTVSHTYGEWIEEAPATCTAKGVKGHYHCSVCNKDFDIDKKELTSLDIEMTEHTWGNYVSDSKYHWRVCTVCHKESEKEEHIIDESNKCTVCGKDFNGTAGVVYEVSSDGTYAIVTDYTGSERDVTIAEEYQNLPVTTIGSSALNYEYTLTKLTIPDSVTTIEYHAISNNFSLSEVHIGKNVKTLGEGAFANNSKLKTIVADELNPYFYTVNNSLIEKSTKKLIVGNGLADIPEGVEIIRKSAYYDFNRPAINIPEGVKEIESFAFRNIYSATSLNIPASVIKIGEGAFNYDSYTVRKLDTITVNAGNTAYTAENNCLIEKATKKIILGCNGSVIPDGTLEIGENAFISCSEITEITVPDTVQRSALSAFHNCNNLKVASFPASCSKSFRKVETANITSGDTIPEEGFNGSLTIKYINMSDSVTTIGRRAFSGCDNITTIKFSNNLTLIGEEAFFDSGITEVTLPSKVTELGYKAFSHCNNLTTVNLSDDLVKIGGNSFYLCKNLTSITMHNKVTDIGDYAFYACIGITDLVLSTSLENIGTYAFSGCKGLTELTLPSSLLTIGDNAFSGNVFQSITIPDKVTKIGASAFAYSESLATVIMGSASPEIGNDAFYNSPVTTVKTTDINAWSQTEFLTETSNPLFSAKNLLLNETPVTQLEILSGATKVGSNAFVNCENLTSVIIPDTVKSIGAGAFKGCVNIKNLSVGKNATSADGKWLDSNARVETLKIPASLIYDGYTSNLKTLEITGGTIIDNTYSNAKLLETVVIGADVKEIGARAFNNCTKLNTVTIGDDVTTISEYAFANCTALTTVHFGKSVNNITSSAFSGCTNINTTDYEGGKYFGDDVNPYKILMSIQDKTATTYKIHADTEIISDSVFSNCSNLTEITLPSKLVGIGNNGFYDCSSLTEITIPDSVKQIGEYAFGYCQGLNVVNMGSGVLKIGAGAFYGVSDTIRVNAKDVSSWAKIDFASRESNPAYLAKKIFVGSNEITEVNIVSGTERIGAYAFYQFAITSLVVPDSVTEIGECAFYECGQLLTVDLGNGIITIGDNAFNSCRKLTSLRLSDTVEKIGNFAFLCCSGMDEVTFGKSLIDIGESAFASCTNIRCVELPDTVESIGRRAFDYCYYLNYAIVGKNIQFIAYDAFYNCNYKGPLYCTATTEVIDGVVYYSEQEPAENKSRRWHYVNNIPVLWSYELDENGVVYSSDQMKTKYNVIGYAGTNSEVVIPGTFNGLPVEAVSIGAFVRNYNITKVVISEGVKSVYKDAFRKCINLKTVEVPTTLGYVDSGAFFDSNSIQYNIYENCKYLGNSSNPYLMAIKVCDQKADNYTIHNDTVVLASYSFAYLTNAKTINIGNKVEKISSEAFVGCNKLETVVIGDSVEFIGYKAFANNNLLKTVTMGKGIKIMGDEVFLNCKVLENVTLGENIETINESVFKNCKKLTNIIMPVSLKEIYGDVFDGCDNFTHNFYKGTKEQWEKVKIIYYDAIGYKTYFYSETKPADEGQYWHYDTDGVTAVQW